MRLSMIFRRIVFFAIFFAAFFVGARAHADVLTPQERLWLESRNNTIIVFPESNNPPFSYQSPAGVIEGVSVDYMQLIAERIGARVEYLKPRSRSQIITEATQGKGDVILTLTPTPSREQQFVFTDSYIAAPFVLVARKDSLRNEALLSDYAGKRVAVTQGSMVEDHVRSQYPKTIVEAVPDDQVALQELLLGQVDVAVMDAASLSYFLSSQTVSSVKVVGTVGIDYLPAFAVTKDKQILQSILEKGFASITQEERKTLAEKWMTLPGAREKPSLFAQLQTSTGMLILYAISIIILIVIILTLLARRHRWLKQFKRTTVVQDLRGELAELEATNQALIEQIQEIKHREESIEQKLQGANQ